MLISFFAITILPSDSCYGTLIVRGKDTYNYEIYYMIFAKKVAPILARNILKTRLISRRVFNAVMLRTLSRQGVVAAAAAEKLQEEQQNYCAEYGHEQAPKVEPCHARSAK